MRSFGKLNFGNLSYLNKTSSCFLYPGKQSNVFSQSRPEMFKQDEIMRETLGENKHPKYFISSIEEECKRFIKRPLGKTNGREYVLKVGLTGLSCADSLAEFGNIMNILNICSTFQNNRNVDQSQILLQFCQLFGILT